MKEYQESHNVEVMAGASFPIGTGVANVMRFADVTLAEAVAMAVDHPARLLGIEPGGLEPGNVADLALFDLVEASDKGGAPRFQVHTTLASGEVVFQRS